MSKCKNHCREIAFVKNALPVVTFVAKNHFYHQKHDVSKYKNHRREIQARLWNCAPSCNIRCKKTTTDSVHRMKCSTKSNWLLTLTFQVYGCVFAIDAVFINCLVQKFIFFQELFHNVARLPMPTLHSSTYHLPILFPALSCPCLRVNFSSVFQVFFFPFVTCSKAFHSVRWWPSFSAGFVALWPCLTLPHLWFQLPQHMIHFNLKVPFVFN